MHPIRALAGDPPDAPPRILVIDDDDVIMSFIEVCLETELPGSTVTKYHSLRSGRPGPDFDWSSHDLLLLDYNLGDGETGVAWLEAFAGRPGFPPTLLITAEDSPRIVGNAVRRGASGYLNKSNLRPEALAEAITGVLSSQSPSSSATPAAGADTGGGTSVDQQAESVVRYRGRHSLDTGPSGSSYRFTRVIGRGAMSRVYLAERSEDSITVVLKILDCDVAQDPENVERFAQEGELLSRVNSPYVVKIYDHGFTNSYGYIAMEFFGRGDLAQRMDQGVSPEDALLYLHNIACGLDAIHGLGIVHRDLKPANVMFRGDGSMALVDFGLSKRVDAGLSLTQTGMILGTPYCMSPEQTEGREADHRADLYAAGVMFYQMLTGCRPFTGANLPQLLLAIQRTPVPPLQGALAAYQGLLDKLMAKKPEDRYQSAGALIAAVSPFLSAY